MKSLVTIKSLRKNKKGFTLIELVIVIAILTILAAIAVPVVGGIITNANKSVDDSNVALFQSAMERYTANGITGDAASGIGNYPASGAIAKAAINTFTSFKGAIPTPKADKTKKYYYVTIGGTGGEVGDVLIASAALSGGAGSTGTSEEIK